MDDFFSIKYVFAPWTLV